MTGPPAVSRTVRPRPWLSLVITASLLSVMSAPGQTAGLSVFTDPLIEELGVGRTEISLAYLIGTLAGASAQPLVGRLLDRWGGRPTTLVIGGAFAVALVGLSLAGEIVGLTFGYVGVRGLGQGALTLAATTALAQHIRHRRGLALGIASAVGSAGISLAPVVLERVIATVGIHVAWRIEAVVVAVVVTSLALLLPRHRPPVVDDPTPSATIRLGARTWTMRQATRTGMFWVLAGSVATSGMLTTGLGFHQIAVLGERGLSPIEAAANFIPQTVTGLLATLAVGALIDRANPRIFLVASMVTLAGSLVLLLVVEPGWLALGYGLVIGAASGALRGLEAASFVRYYGTEHIGSIRGVATAIGLGSTALGPLLLSLGHDATGSFATPSAWLAIIPIGVALAALVVRDPVKPEAGR